MAEPPATAVGCLDDFHFDCRCGCRGHCCLRRCAVMGKLSLCGGFSLGVVSPVRRTGRQTTASSPSAFSCEAWRVRQGYTITSQSLCTHTHTQRRAKPAAEAPWEAMRTTSGDGARNDRCRQRWHGGDTKERNEQREGGTDGQRRGARLQTRRASCAGSTCSVAQLQICENQLQPRACQF